MATKDNFTCTFTYDSASNTTLIGIETYIKNNTIYTMDSVSMELNLYNDESLVEKNAQVKSYTNIKYGNKKNVNIKYNYVEGEVNKIEFISWTASYKSIWNTYVAWFISIIVIISIIALFFLLIIIIQDLELDDITDFFTDHKFILLLICIPFIPSIINDISIGSWSWVPPIIIVAGIISLIIFGLVAFGIKYLITDVL